MFYDYGSCSIISGMYLCIGKFLIDVGFRNFFETNYVDWQHASAWFAVFSLQYYNGLNALR
jgi:hypothetical protein